MPKSNIRLLTKEERKYMNSTYIFTVKNDLILVKVKDFARVTSHSIDEDFSIKSKMRKIKITKDAIKLWSTVFINSKWTLVDVQNAINSLLITYQQIDVDKVEMQLRRIDENDNTYKVY